MFEPAVLYTFVIALELAWIGIRSLDVFYYFHDRFDPENIGGPGYLGPRNWKRIFRGASVLALPLLLVVWVLEYFDELAAALLGFVGIYLYNILLRALISDEVEKGRRKDWRYGWY